MSTPSRTIDTWHCQRANDAHQVIMQIWFISILLSLHTRRLCNLLTLMYGIARMHSTLQMSEVLLLLCNMQTMIRNILTAHCRAYICLCSNTTVHHKMHLLHQMHADQTHSRSIVLCAPYVTPKPSLVPSTAHANSPLLYYKPPKIPAMLQKTHYKSRVLWTPPITSQQAFCPSVLCFQEAIYASPGKEAYAIVTYSMPAGACSDATSMFLAPLQTEEVMAPVGPPSPSCWRGASRGLCMSSSDMVKNWACTMHMSDFIKYTSDMVKNWACTMQMSGPHQPHK